MHSGGPIEVETPLSFVFADTSPVGSVTYTLEAEMVAVSKISKSVEFMQ